MALPPLELIEELIIENDDEFALDASAPETLYAACRGMTHQFIAGQMDDLFKVANDQLFKLAKDALSDDAQRDFFDSMQELHRLRATVEKGFGAALDERFEEAWQADLIGVEPEVPPVDEGDMALLDTQSIDDEVRIIGIVSHAAGAVKHKEFELKERLSVLLSVPLVAETNPLTVQSVCFAFHAALKNLGIERQTRRALFKGLSDCIASHLGVLLDKVNQFLIERDILPDGPLRVTKKTPSAPADAHARKGSTPDSDGNSRAVAGEGTKPASPASEQHGVSDRTTLAGGSVRPSAEVAFAGASTSARTLMALGRAIDAGRTDLIDATYPGGKPGVRDILGQALAQIQVSGEAESWGQKGPFALAQRLDKKLAEYGVTVSDAAVKDVVDIISNLFDSVLADPLVDHYVKGWIRAIAIPVLRAALTDGSFFASDAHPARGVINILGESGFGRPAPSTPEVTFREKTDGVLRDLLTATGSVGDAFRATEESLREIHSEQTALRARNLKKAIEALAIGEPTSKGEQTSGIDDQLKLAGLSVGGVVMLRSSGLGPHRAELGWRSPDGQNYLFVDALGHRLTSLDAAHLARCLEGRLVEPVEIARMPVIDRAMCGVLQGIHEKLEHKATCDPATGLATIKPLERAIKRALEHATAPGTHHHLAYIGIDTFAEIAERTNQETTVKFAKQYANVLERQMGEKGLVARVAPACFVLFLPGSRRADIEGFVERHCKSVEVAKLAYKGVDLPLQVSVGVVGLAAGIDDPALAISAAHDAFVAAEKMEGNSTFFAQTPVEAVSRATKQRRGRADDNEGGKPFHAYVDGDELGLRAQRVEAITAEDGSSAGLPYYEVLLGIRHGHDGGLRPPGDVVLAAERNGDIGELDRWVLNAALVWMASRTKWLRSVKGLSINLSGSTLDEPGLAEEIHALIDRYAVDPNKIMFEVTESAAIGHLAAAKGFIESLRERGCRFALDDFGAGHASFSYLKLLPVDTVKIDGLFVRDIVSNPTDQAMVRSINEIAKLLGKQTVAEFVANDEALDVLRRLGVDYAQGYGIERPMPIDDI
jgi:EAL domain-containing protein (putative c-di-GMP-specific phosphodiesterase class I)/GGDEF domain-containing protein